MLRRVRQMQAEALAANLPMGQRGPSVIMAAALDCFEQLPPKNRLEAVKNRLGA
jgi:sulfopyruvate decarboxylase TPP-binding subunit